MRAGVRPTPTTLRNKVVNVGLTPALPRPKAASRKAVVKARHEPLSPDAGGEGRRTSDPIL